MGTFFSHPFEFSGYAASGKACDYADIKFEKNGKRFTAFRVYTRADSMIAQPAEDMCKADGGYLPVLNTRTRNEKLLEVTQTFGRGAVTRMCQLFCTFIHSKSKRLVLISYIAKYWRSMKDTYNLYKVTRVTEYQTFCCYFLNFFTVL